MASDVIDGVYGAEPMREGEEPAGATVGHHWLNKGLGYKVVAIDRREENLGTYGIVWYDVFVEGNQLVASFNAVHVAEVHYGR